MKRLFLFIRISMLMFMSNSYSRDKCDMGDSVVKYNKLTLEEERVIVDKGTEPPGSGKYNKFKKRGIYYCKRCNAALYKSDDKFDSGCGWPSFDDEIKGAIEYRTDDDGFRTEIMCKACGAHLGHVFKGEGFTPKNTRHCVNSISLNFKDKFNGETNFKNRAPETQTAIFAGGCFWGVEYYFQNLKGVVSTTVGYTGGDIDNPTYKDVCYTDTGHAEALKVIFNPQLISYEDLVKLFFEIHDPTQINRQGPDIGTQYRSAVFYTNNEQKVIAEKLISYLQKDGLDVATEISPFKKFWKAEEFHQKYYSKTGKQPYCHRRIKRFK